jgi:predicted transcriptional regulator
MELYDCPDYSDKDTQSGLTIVENAALSILGVTTPSSLSSAVSDADWSNGLLIRFGLLTPEDNYLERPAPEFYQPPPPNLITDLRELHDRLPQAEETGDGFKPPKSIEFDVECWEACRAYGAELRQLCNPNRENELDERLKGVYGRMHVQALKLAQLLAALDWLDTVGYTPTITIEHWRSAKAIADQWCLGAARLLAEIDKSGEAIQERRDQDRLLRAIQRTGATGSNLRDLYRNLNLSAKRARQLAHDLVKAGLVTERQFQGAEWYVAMEFLDPINE